MAFAADDDLLVTSIYSRVAWSIESGEPVWRNTDQVQTFGGAPIAVDHRDELVAWPSITNGFVTVVDVRTGEPVWSIPLPAAVAVDFHPRLDVLLVKSQFLGAQMYDYSSGAPEMVFDVRLQAPTDAVFDASGERFAVGGVVSDSGNGTAIFAANDPEDPGAGWNQIAVVQTGAPLPLSLTFLPGTTDIAAGQPRNAGIWSTVPAGEVGRMRLSSPAWTIDAVPGTDLVISSHPPNFGRDALVVQDTVTGEIVFVSEGTPTQTDWVVARATSSTRAVAVLPAAEEIAVIDPRSGEVVARLEPPADEPLYLNVVDISADGTVVVGGHLDTSGVTVWDGATGQILESFDVTDLGTIQSVRLSPDRSFLAVGGDDGVAIVELTPEGPLDPILLPADGNNHGIAISPDGSTVASADDTFGLLNVFDVESAERIVAVPVSGAFDPEFTEDGSQLVFAAAQSGVVAFDTDTWTRRWTIPSENLPNGVLTLDIAGDRLIFADVTGFLHVLTLDHDELIEIALARVNRSLTELECANYRIDPCPSLEEMRSR